MSRAAIPAGVGFHVGVNFARAKADLPLTITEISGPLAFGFIPADPGSPLGFLRRGNLQEQVYVHVDARYLRDEQP